NAQHALEQDTVDRAGRVHVAFVEPAVGRAELTNAPERLEIAGVGGMVHPDRIPIALRARRATRPPPPDGGGGRQPGPAVRGARSCAAGARSPGRTTAWRSATLLL